MHLAWTSGQHLITNQSQHACRSVRGPGLHSSPHVAYVMAPQSVLVLTAQAALLLAKRMWQDRLALWSAAPTSLLISEHRPPVACLPFIREAFQISCGLHRYISSHGHALWNHGVAEAGGVSCEGDVWQRDTCCHYPCHTHEDSPREPTFSSSPTKWHLGAGHVEPVSISYPQSHFTQCFHKRGLLLHSICPSILGGAVTSLGTEILVQVLLSVHRTHRWSACPATATMAPAADPIATLKHTTPALTAAAELNLTPR